MFPQVYQRESLLGLALEYNMLGFLRSCITQWASGGMYSSHKQEEFHKKYEK